MAKFINVSNADINLYTPQGDLVEKLKFDKEEWGALYNDIARSNFEKEKADPIDSILCAREVSRNPQKLPEMKEGVFYVVHPQVFKTLKRKDIVTWNQGCHVKNIGIDDDKGFYGLLVN